MNDYPFDSCDNYVCATLDKELVIFVWLILTKRKFIKQSSGYVANPGNSLYV